MFATMLCLTLLAGTPNEPRWGHEPYAVASPLDVAVAPDGRMFVADAEAGQVVVLSPDFKPAGPALPAPQISGLAVAKDGRLAVLVRAHTEPQFAIYGPDGKVLTNGGAGDTSYGGLSAPQGLCFDAAGNLFVFDTGAGRVLVFDGTGQFVFAFSDYTWARKYHSRKENKDIDERVADQLYRPCRGAFLPDGRLIIADYDGPLQDLELQRRAGVFGVWRVDVAAKSATFEKFLPQGDYYPDSKAGAVAVDPQSGAIYVAEADFPLTDHDMIRVYDNVDSQPRYTTNFSPYRLLTHPRGIAVAQNGDVVVADADMRLVFALSKKLFSVPVGEHDPLEWPKRFRVPVCERERIVIEYTTPTAVRSRLEFTPLEGDWYEYPQPPAEAGKIVLDVPALNDRWQPLAPDAPGVNHRVELAGLRPGQRYVCHYLVSESAYPEPLWSMPLLLTTQPPAARTQYLDAEVLVLLFTNLQDPVKDANVRPQPAAPGPMTPADIAGVKERLDWARRFYWINSRCRFNLHYKLVIDDELYNPAPVVNYGYWPDDDHRKIDAILAVHGEKHENYAGLVVLYGYRHWDDREKKWVLSGSGGNTWGSCHDGSAICTFSCGGDTGWLMTHEYGHGMGINYQYSGHVFHFNHFHWNYLPTDYGAHYDGMSALCREFSDVAYWSNKYGRLRVVADVDEDGLPDADPACYLDEQRFGSDPAQRDTDGDGLSDLEELMTTAGLANYDQAFGMRQIKPVFEPGPRNKDTDGDGVPDAEDLYPLYPWDPNVRQAHVTVDGHINADEWPQAGFRRVMADPELSGDVRLAWDAHNLYLGLTQQVTPGNTRPARLYLELDANNDGMTVGSDNLELRLDPQPDGSVKIETRHNDTVIRTKPIWRDNILPSPLDMQARWTTVGDAFHLEIAIPQTKDAGLDLVRNEQLGFMLQLKPEASKQELRLFEPLQHFDVRLR
jgi:hypothetical protein